MLLGITEGIYIHLKFLLELVAERFKFLFPLLRPWRGDRAALGRFGSHNGAICINRRDLYECNIKEIDFRL